MGIGSLECVVCKLISMNNHSLKSVPHDYEKSWQYWHDRTALGPGSRHVRRLVMRMMKSLDFKTCLDAGCGEGSLLMAIHAQFPDAELHGIDFSNTAIKTAQKNIPEAKIHKMDLTRQSLPQKFDLIACVDVLEHIEDDQSVLNHLYQMSGGYLLLVVPIGPLHEQERERLGHLHGYSRDELKAKLSQAGFKVLREISWGFPLYSIYRRLVMNLPDNTTSGKFNWKKRLVSEITYLLLFLNLPFWGDRYHILCHV